MGNYNSKYSGLDFRHRNDLRQASMLIRAFKSSPAYYEVDKYNIDNTITEYFPLQIFNSTRDDNIYKKFITHPDYNLKYGDIIDENDNFYIVYKIKYMNDINSEGTFRLCNNIIAWEWNGRVINQYSYIDSFNVSGDDNKNLNLLDGSIKMYIPYNDNTKNIYENQRFIIGNLELNVFRVDSIEDISKDGMLIIKLEADEFDNRDDLITKVAYNESNIVSNLIESTIDDSYYIVSPEDISIRSKETIDINIAHYDNNNTIITTDFTYTIIDINAIDYDLIEIDETNIQIKNNKYPNDGILNIKNEDNGETIAIELKFIGLW